MESWRYGLKKISLTNLQRQMLGIRLKEAKDNTDALLDGKQITLEIEDQMTAEKFANEIEKIGVNCTIKV